MVTRERIRTTGGEGGVQPPFRIEPEADVDVEALLDLVDVDVADILSVAVELSTLVSTDYEDTPLVAELAADVRSVDFQGSTVVQTSAKLTSLSAVYTELPLKPQVAIDHLQVDPAYDARPLVTRVGVDLTDVRQNYRDNLLGVAVASDLVSTDLEGQLSTRAALDLLKVDPLYDALPLTTQVGVDLTDVQQNYRDNLLGVAAAVTLSLDPAYQLAAQATLDLLKVDPSFAASPLAVQTAVDLADVQQNYRDNFVGVTAIADLVSANLAGQLTAQAAFDFLKVDPAYGALPLSTQVAVDLADVQQNYRDNLVGTAIEADLLSANLAGTLGTQAAVELLAVDAQGTLASQAALDLTDVDFDGQLGTQVAVDLADLQQNYLDNLLPVAVAADLTKADLLATLVTQVGADLTDVNFAGQLATAIQVIFAADLAYALHTVQASLDLTDVDLQGLTTVAASFDLLKANPAFDALPLAPQAGVDLTDVDPTVDLHNPQAAIDFTDLDLDGALATQVAFDLLQANPAFEGQQLQTRASTDLNSIDPAGNLVARVDALLSAVDADYANLPLTTQAAADLTDVDLAGSVGASPAALLNAFDPDYANLPLSPQAAVLLSAVDTDYAGLPLVPQPAVDLANVDTDYGAGLPLGGAIDPDRVDYRIQDQVTADDAWVTTDGTCSDDTNKDNDDITIVESADLVNQDGYVKFDLSGFDSGLTVTDAKLTFDVTNISDADNDFDLDTLDISDSDEGTWQEDTITCSNRPAGSSVLQTIDVTSTGTHTIDLNSSWLTRIGERLGTTSLTMVLQINSGTADATFRSKDQDWDEDATTNNHSLTFGGGVGEDAIGKGRDRDGEKHPHGFDLDGTDDHLENGDAGLQITGDLTETIAFVADDVSSFQVIGGWILAGSEGGGDNTLYGLFIESDGQIRYFHETGSGGGNVIKRTQGTISTGFHTITLRRDVSNNIIHLFVDGTYEIGDTNDGANVDGTYSSGDDPSGGSNGTFFMGAENDGAGGFKNFMDGAILEWRVWDSLVAESTALDIADDTVRDSAGFESELEGSEEAAWFFGDDPDREGFSLDLTLEASNP